MDPYTILTDARAIMAERGKTEGFLLGPDGRVCIRGAMVLAAGYPEKDLAEAYFGNLPQDILVVIDECERLMGFGSEVFCGGAGWNNDPEVTTEMVLDRIEQGIEATKELVPA